MSMKYIFLGCTNFSAEVLFHLTDNKFWPEAIFTIPKEFQISYSDDKVKNTNFFDFRAVSILNSIPIYTVESSLNKSISDYSEIISEIKPDVIIVVGWYYMVPKEIRDLAIKGAWGIHASLLPNYAGGAPLVWAIINGEEKTGVSLFKLESGIDDGPIIAQKEISINKDDHIKEVYKKATEASKILLLKSLKNIDKLIPKVQNKKEIVVYPQRSPKDGLIDWEKSPKEIYDFIRAQSKPYPGAFFIVGNKKVIIWDVTIETIKD